MLKSILYVAAIVAIAMGFTFLNNTWTFDPPTNDIESIFYQKENNPNWLVVKEGVNVRAAEIVEKYKGQLGLGLADELILYRMDEDEIGFSHYRFQHYHKGVKVEGSQLLIHEKEGKALHLNGRLARGLNKTVDSKVTKGEAIEIAIKALPAQKYMWESRTAEDLKKRIQKDPDATFYPKAELMLVDPSFDTKPENISLVYSLIVHSLEPEMRKRFFVDAQNGEIIHAIDMMHTQAQNTDGTAETKYHGTRQIVTDSVAADSFRLVETTRGYGIETYDMNTGTNIDNAVDFWDEDNYWNNVNSEQDEVATDAHWGAEMTFDYYYHNHNHLGVDGDSMALISYVHVNTNWTNATWNGSFARFGDSSPPNSPLTALDVVGHEFTHGITDFTADLVYQDESGALNESFSDIFGTALEFWADPATADWYIGEDFLEEPFRNMADPREFGDPDTYFGDGWYTGTGDNGGVHTNSGVQNFWFHLLTEGGADTNDLDNVYLVHGLGIDTAAQIAFRNLKYYLTVNSEYEDARLGAIQASEDLFGPCSFPVKQTISAWYAVGVGPENPILDFHLLGILEPIVETCGVSDQEMVTIELVYSDCDSVLSAGMKIPLYYQINGGTEVWDTLVLGNSLQGGDTVTFTFSTPVAELAMPGTYVLTAGAALNGDNTAGNNSKQVELERIYDQNIDLGTVGVEAPLPGCFLSKESVAIEIGFYGCDSINAGESLDVFYSINGNTPIQESIVLPNILYRGDTFIHSFADSADLSEIKVHSFDVWATYMPDSLNANDSIYGHFVVNPIIMKLEDIVTFEEPIGSLDSFYYITSEHSRAFISSAAAKDSEYGFQVTGGDVLNEYFAGRVALPELDTIWEINPQFRSKVCFCADLTNLQDADLKFRMKQTYSPIYELGLGQDLREASAARVLVDGIQISDTYLPLANTNSPYFPRTFSLLDYVGSKVEICFESSTLLDVALDPFGIGDNLYLENVTIEGVLVNASEASDNLVGMNVYPNPSSGTFEVEIVLDQSTEAELKLFDTHGRIIWSDSSLFTSGKNKLRPKTHQLTAGVYYLQVKTDNKLMVKEVIVQ